MGFFTSKKDDNNMVVDMSIPLGDKPDVDITDITRRDLAMLYLGIALETRRSIENKPEIRNFMIKILRRAVLASVPEYNPEQIKQIQDNIKKMLLKGVLMKELDKAANNVMRGKNPFDI